jgi:hypothetical protein
MAATEAPMISMREHPKAARLVRRAKAWGGLAGFALVCLGTLLKGGVLFDACLRGLAAGFIGYFVAWRAAVGIAKHLMQAHAQTAVEAALERRRERERQRAAEKAEAAA